MKVLFLTHNFPRRHGDHAGAFVLRLAKALQDRGVTVNVVAPTAHNGEADTEVDGIHVERFRYAPRRYETLAYTGNMAADVAKSWSSRLALLGFLGADFSASVRARRRLEPDVIHAHWWFPAGLVGTWTAGLGHTPLITTLHGTDVRLARKLSVSRPLFRHVLRHSATVTAVSSWLAETAAEIASVPTPTVAPMPVSTELFAAPADGQQQREGLLFVGRLTHQKGPAQLLRAVAQMQAKPSVEIVGDGPLWNELHRLADELGIADRVRWAGVLPQPALAERYRRAEAVVMPSTGEGFGMVAVEAALCETPVVAFSSGGLRDIVRDGSTGVLVPEGNAEALAAALDSLLADGGRARDLGSAARMFALSTFAPESAAEKYLSLYEQAVGAKP